MRAGFRQKTFPLFLVFLLLSLLLILLDNWGILRPVRGGVERWVVPLKAGIYKVKQQSFKITGELDEEKERKIAVLESQIAVLKSENEAMRRLLAAPLPPAWRFMPAQVIGLPSSDNLQIDKGRAEGVRKGMAVVFENVLVGRVSWVGEHFSRVLLPTASSSKILVVSRASGGEGIKARGLLLGQAGRVSLKRVLPQEALDEGDLVLTAGDEELPPNLPLGRIGKIKKVEGEIYQEAEVRLLLEPAELETVFAIVFW